MTDIQIDISKIKDKHHFLIKQLEIHHFFRKFGDFRDKLEKEGKYLHIVMRMIETLFLFIRSTRQELWDLHLVALDRFSNFFFILDLSNYARMTPIYLSDMYQLKETDGETWSFLKINFCCRKSITPFTAIGVDHALEQINRELKVMGGIVGLSHQQLDRYCIIAPTKRLLID